MRIEWSKNPADHSRAKHINLEFHLEFHCIIAKPMGIRVGRIRYSAAVPMPTESQKLMRWDGMAAARRLAWRVRRSTRHKCGAAH